MESCPFTSFNRSCMLVRPSPGPLMALSVAKPIPESRTVSSISLAPRLSATWNCCEPLCLIAFWRLPAKHGTDKGRSPSAVLSGCFRSGTQSPHAADRRVPCKNQLPPLRDPGSPASGNGAGVIAHEHRSRDPRLVCVTFRSRIRDGMLAKRGADRRRHEALGQSEYAHPPMLRSIVGLR
jgi:hypothetical protein